MTTADRSTNPVMALAIALALGVSGTMAPAVFAAPVVQGGNLIQGQIMTSSNRQMIVRIETSGGTVYQEVYSSPDGRFLFQNAPLDPDQFYFLVVDEEGFKPYRERLDYRTGGRRDNRLFVYLEPAEVAAAASGPSVVDISQLALDVPEDALDAYEDGLAAIDDGDLEEARERLERAVELAPDFFNAQDELGALYTTLGQFDQARVALDAARELSPAATRPLLNLGTMHYKAGETHLTAERFNDAAREFIEAANTLEQVIRADPGAALAYQNMGAALYRLQEYAAAEALLLRGLEVDPGLHESRLLLVNVFNRQGRYDDALGQLAAYLDQNPNSPQREALGRLRSSIESAKEATSNETPEP